MSAEMTGERHRPRRGTEAAEPYDWRTHRPGTWPNQWREEISLNPGGAEDILATREAQMDLVAEYARIEGQMFKDNKAMIDWGRKRGIITAPEAKNLRTWYE